MSKTATNDEEVILTLRFCNGELFVKSSLRDELRQVLGFPSLGYGLKLIVYIIISLLGSNARNKSSL